MSTGPDVVSGELKSIRKAFEVIELLKERNGAGVTEIANELGWAKSTAYNYLRTLTNNEYVVQEGDQYHLGLRFLDLGKHVSHRKDLYELADKKVKELANETGERAQFVVLEHRKAVYVRQAIGDSGVHTDAEVGSRLDLHATAAGKAILSKIPDDEREEILDRIEMRSYTENTIKHRKELQQEIEEIQSTNIARNGGEIVDGMNAVAVPVTDANEQVYGSLCVSGPAHRMTDERIEDHLAEYILGSANELELNLEYSRESVRTGTGHFRS
ncbi:MAG: IclR family transcriptional regulator [Halapricum sp.]